MTAYREPVAVAAAPVTTRRMVRVVGATPNLVSIAIDGDSQFRDLPRGPLSAFEYAQTGDVFFADVELTPDRLWLSYVEPFALDLRIGGASS